MLDSLKWLHGGGGLLPSSRILLHLFPYIVSGTSHIVHYCKHQSRTMTCSENTTSKTEPEIASFAGHDVLGLCLHSNGNSNLGQLIWEVIMSQQPKVSLVPFKLEYWVLNTYNSGAVLSAVTLPVKHQAQTHMWGTYLSQLTKTLGPCTLIVWICWVGFDRGAVTMAIQLSINKQWLKTTQWTVTIYTTCNC